MTASLRQHYERLITGETGTTRTLTSGRFVRRAPDGGIEQHPASSAERHIEVILGPPAETPPGVNPLDGFGFFTQRLTVRVSYLLTHAGGDLTEALGEQDGAGTWDVIRDRAITDALDLQTVLSWHENRSGTDPVIVQVVPLPAVGPTRQGVLAILEQPFDLVVKATLPGSYAP